MASLPPPPQNAVRIYVYGDPDNKIIKVGRTSQKGMSRKQQHEQRGPEDVEMTFICELWGLPSGETALKTDLKTIAIPRPGRSEWYEVTEETRDWLRFLRKQWFVATKEGEIESLLAFPELEMWLPRFTTNRSPRYAEQHAPQLTFDDCDDDADQPWADLKVDQVMEGDFYTSPELIPAITEALGGEISLDPASCKEANGHVKARNFFGFKEDGLSQEWGGHGVYINAPFGQWRLWAPKILREWQSGRISHLIVMAPSRASTSHEFHPIIQNCDAIFWPRGRYSFKGPLASSPDEGHFLFYFGDEPQRFCKVLAPFGTCFPTGRGDM